ncbi:MAG: bifunctional heptose 7-phosphate kinase/heptose 1-phosphate adenyltransferase, partial [Deltaproteobacteria bacterium]|nr:bifunctional heptose 7-phosphate kinase/heptose 1-phosphate adenyltransferase [Deltaproteobacteria bacterium]
VPARARQVYDVSGAGDTVLAVCGLALASGADMRRSARLANLAAGVVVGKVGTAALSPEELLKELEEAPEPGYYKQKDLAALSAAVGEARRQGKKIVLTNGCFDLLHAGHVRLFAQSKRLGDVLVVAVDDDDGVRAVKGPGRPVIPQDQRVSMISAIDPVDYVTVFSHGGLEEVIRAVKPDVLTKGSNYEGEPVEGQDLVESLGGRVELIEVTDVSASQIINGIRNIDH